MIKKSLPFLLLAFLALMAVGCCPTTTLNLTVTLDDSFRQALGSTPVEVDVIGISPNEHQRFQNYSMTDYWQPGDATRNSFGASKVTLRFDPKDPKTFTQTISRSDPHWTQWLSGSTDKDKPRIYFLAQMPGNFSKAVDDKPGDQDKRRQILPTGECRWETHDVKLVLKETGIITETQQKRDKAGQ